MNEPNFSPQAFGRYVLVDKIATGGMAEIFKAKTYSDGGFESLLVIKRILPHIGENSDFVSMFVDEAKISVALKHPNIVRVHDFGRIRDNYFIAMECVEGKDTRNFLRKLARRKTWLPEKFAAYFAHEVCKGLHYAHNKTDQQGRSLGIVHRDISPSNVIVSYEGEIKIADFGIAKAERNAYQTRDGMLKGKFEYMSPEQASGREIDHRSDLFSLGIILYEMLTAKRLFKTDSEIATLARVRDGDIEAPSRIKADVSPSLEAICMRALCRDPGDRYQSADQMADDLREYLFPDTADTIRRELKGYLADLFHDEIAEERQRLEAGSAIALQLKDRLTAEWDGVSPEVTMTRVTQTAVRHVVPWIAAIGLGMLVIFGAALVGLFVYMTQNPLVAAQPATVDGPTGVEVVVTPAAEVSIDGEVKGSGTKVRVDNLQPGSYLLHLEADGYAAVDEPVVVEAGKITSLAKKLEPEKASAPARPPQVDFRSSPPGATVIVDGAELGVTPLVWDGGKLGGQYAIKMKLDGYQSREDQIKSLRKGTTKFTLNLQPLNLPSSLVVVLDGPGWANVYVDGNKLSKTAPLRDVVITPGSHKIRVENPSTGLDVVETHTFVGGKTTTVRVKMD
jgi:Protein kinase domain/PEGA domain